MGRPRGRDGRLFAEGEARPAGAAYRRRRKLVGQAMIWAANSKRIVLRAIIDQPTRSPKIGRKQPHWMSRPRSMAEAAAPRKRRSRPPRRAAALRGRMPSTKRRPGTNSIQG